MICKDFLHLPHIIADKDVEGKWWVANCKFRGNQNHIRLLLTLSVCLSARKEGCFISSRSYIQLTKNRDGGIGEVIIYRDGRNGKMR
jgi:hypothetical protein